MTVVPNMNERQRESGREGGSFCKKNANLRKDGKPDFS